MQLLGILDAGVAAAEAGTRAELLLEVRCACAWHRSFAVLGHKPAHAAGEHRARRL